MVVATAQGIFSSSDGGGSWRPRDAIPSEQLAWAAPDALYRADPGGLIKVSADGGATWKDRGTRRPVGQRARRRRRRRALRVGAGRGGQALDRRRRDLGPAREAEVARLRQQQLVLRRLPPLGHLDAPPARRRRRSRSACSCPPARRPSAAPVDSGSIVPVERRMPPVLAPSSSVSNVTFCAAPDWLEMRITTGPAPNVTRRDPHLLARRSPR